MTGVKILIVEDERIIAHDLQRRLTKLGYRVPALATTAEAAFRLIGEIQPDLVLMDIRIDGPKDGIDAAREIRESCGIPVVFLSAFSEETTLERARAVQPYGFLVKPFSERELHATIQMALERHRFDTSLAANETRLRLALESARLGIWEIDAGEDDAAATARPVPAATADDLAYGDMRKWLDHIVDEDRPRLVSAIQEIRGDRKQPREIEFRVRDGEQGLRWMRLFGQSFNGSRGGMARAVGVVQDITQRREAEERLRQAASVFECASEAIMILRGRDQVDSVNLAFTSITGHEPADVLERERPLLETLIDDGPAYDAIWACVAERGRWQGEVQARRKNGDRFNAWLSVGRIHGAASRDEQHVVVFSDISALRVAEDRIAWLAHYDPLTSLPNRTQLIDRLDLAVERAQRTATAIAVLFIDLDHFKRVNDTLGHPAGDELLCAASLRLQACLRSTDTLGRVGGDEFVVVLDQLATTDAVGAVAGKLIEALSSPFNLGSHQTTIGASIGISLYPKDADNREGLLRTADTAMYSAKQQGRNKCLFYSPAMTVRIQQFQNRERELRQALAERQFVLMYEPQVALDSLRVVGAETLIRWEHPTLGLLGAAEVIPAAEESGLIIEIGEWVLREACRQARAWHDLGLPPLRLSVNTSVVQISRDGFLDMAKRAIQDYAIEPGMIELEVTESILQRDDNCIAPLQALKKLGVSVAIDDFGTGYSSLSALKRLPVDRVKIDQIFVRGIPDDAKDEAIIWLIAAACRALKLQLVAEGVETQAQADFLRKRGCREAQGYLYSKPVAPQAIVDMLRRGSVHAPP